MAQEATGSGKSEKKDPVMVEQAAGSEMTAEGRDEAASKLVDRFSLWSGAAGLIPVPLIDVVAVGGVQLQMLRRLSQIYGVPFSDNLGKSVIASLAGSMIPATSGMGVASAMKGVPLIGMTVAVLTMPALSAGATYAIGKAFIQHFRSGGTLLDFNPPDYKEFIKTQKEKWIGRSAATPPAAQPAASQPTSSTRSGSSKGAAATSS
jgi:uncharacterized protein (DUF697 family)